MRRVLLLAAACLFAAGSTFAAEYVFQFGFETPRTDSQFIGAEHFAKVAAEKSGGRIEIQLYPDGVLGNGPTMLADMQGGDLDMYMGGSGFFANMAQKLNILDIPFLFRGTKHVDTLLEGDFGRLMLDELNAHEIKGLAFWENGFRCLTNLRNPVKVAADVKGMKLRTLANPMHIEAWTLLGTNPVPMPLSELYTALETKTVEGQEHPLNVTYSAKLYEVQKYISASNHAYSPLIVGMNLDRFNSLPKDIQDILIESCIEGARYQKNYIRSNIAKMVEEMKAFGCEVVPAEQVDMKSFQDVVGGKTRAMYLEQYGGDTGQQWLKIIDDGAIDG